MPPTLPPYFGRAYSLIVTPSRGSQAGTPIIVASSDAEPHALRFTFEIEQRIYGPWTARIRLYNGDGQVNVSGSIKTFNLFDAVFQEGDRVQVCAGYLHDYPKGTTPPVIWDGPLFYPRLYREGGVDKVLELNCVMARTFTTQNFINEVMPKLSTQYSLAQLAASHSMVPFNVESGGMPASFGTVQLPRARSIFGNPETLLKGLARQNNAAGWFDADGWKISPFSNLEGDPIATYAPLPVGQSSTRKDGISYTLIDTPQQTQMGVDFTVLLDGVVQISRPLMKVAISQQYVRAAEISYPLPIGSGLPRPLTASFVVVGVSFEGDTRGTPWYAHVTAYGTASDQLALLGNVLNN